MDVSLFPGRVFVNQEERAGNNIDDDHNGYIDDVYGIGWSQDWEKNVGPLRTVSANKEEMEQYKRLNKGYLDLQAAVDSQEASDFRKRMANLPKEEVKPLLEGLGLYGNYSHGTHVAGIAAKGNPAIRLLVARMDFSYELIPRLPILDRVNKFAIVLRETISYFRRHGVRVVNISWTDDTPKSYEDCLEYHNAGGTPAERKALARQFFDICNSAFRSAMTDATEILFICSAGNSDNDVRFAERIPSSYDLPNVMSIGATDKAGDEAACTVLRSLPRFASSAPDQILAARLTLNDVQFIK
jgi:subtilisin family serine protease